MDMGQIMTWAAEIARGTVNVTQFLDYIRKYQLKNLPRTMFLCSEMI